MSRRENIPRMLSGGPGTQQRFLLLERWSGVYFPPLEHGLVSELWRGIVVEATLNFRALRGMAAFTVILLDLRHPHENKPELASCGVRARPRSSECHTPDARVELFWTVWLPADHRLMGKPSKRESGWPRSELSLSWPTGLWTKCKDCGLSMMLWSCFCFF